MIWFRIKLRLMQWGLWPRRKPSRIDRKVLALMTLLDPEDNIGFTIRATPEAIEQLKASDSPFAGYVISCVVEDDAESKAHYDDWTVRTLERRPE